MIWLIRPKGNNNHLLQYSFASWRNSGQLKVSYCVRVCTLIIWAHTHTREKEKAFCFSVWMPTQQLCRSRYSTRRLESLLLYRLLFIYFINLYTWSYQISPQFPFRNEQQSIFRYWKSSNQRSRWFSPPLCKHTKHTWRAAHLNGWM